MLGKAWDAITEPLLSMRLNGSIGAIQAVSKVEIWCRREDLNIERIQIKEEGTWTKIWASVGFENRLAAAEAYIRNTLSSRNLDIRNFEDPFGHLKLADIAVAPMVEP